MIRAITLDFGNTLVPVPAGIAAVIATTDVSCVASSVSPLPNTAVYAGFAAAAAFFCLPVDGSCPAGSACHFS